jgi:hypothetical protein
MTTVAEQVHYESRLRFRYAGVAFAAAILLIISELLQLSGPKPPVSEATVSLITYDSRATIDTFASAVDLVGLLALAILLFWLHRSAQARAPQLRALTRWAASSGAVLAGVMGLVYTVIFIQKAHQFVTTGDQSWPEADNLFKSALWVYPQLILELGNLLLAVGAILVSLNVMRVGLVPRIVGYAGVIAGALFIFGVPLLTPIIQGFWLASTAVVLARRWPSGDPPAWESGVAVPWPQTQRQQAQEQRSRQRGGGGRRRVSDKDVIAAVEKHEAPANPQAGRSKRKRRK